MQLAGAFGAGAALGALVWLPLVLIGNGLVSPVPSTVRVVAFVALSTAIASTMAITGTNRLPHTHSQIPADVITARRPGGAARFGAMMGTGLRTFLPSPAPHVLVLGLVLLPPGPFTIVLACLGFGVGRGSGLVGRALVRDRGAFEARFQVFVGLLQRYLAPISVAGTLWLAHGWAA